MLGLTSGKLFSKQIFASSARFALRPTTAASPITSLLKMSRPAMIHTSNNLRVGKQVPNPENVPVLPMHKSVVIQDKIGLLLPLSLLPIVGVSVFYGPQPINDLLLGIIFPLHAYNGISAVVLDYFPKRRSPVPNFIFMWMLNIGTLVTLYGCWLINTNDIGLTAFAYKLWNSDKKTIEE
ncbi:hypothetical protein BB559_001989 [Furculomyces boomerangus]|uniref:Succinate dehydrogenase [ubiquinone] cytochrome b small subunit n=2 Tax=Harpellales TaxID=61421 RepID=A0A2T9YYZ8_9FUNG|nr:hypothetical protein BB559_001989 [Furculomyces boomerangus]PVZ96938.1 hypothetical protein BB558_007141 [Smittium angustum]PVZ98201.1 hypothetical protein BB558_005788 [Smittium angustum]